MKLHHPQLKGALEPLVKLVLAITDPKSIGGVFILFGSNGCGKSHVAHGIEAIFKDRRMKIGPTHVSSTSEHEADCKIVESRFVHWPSAVEGIKKEQWIIFEDCCAEYFVTLDDIGAEHDPSGIGLEKLYLILNRREFKHTLITTNFPPQEWESKFERRIASRLFRNATHIDLSEVPDYSTI